MRKNWGLNGIQPTPGKDRKKTWLYRLVKIEYSSNGGSVVWIKYLKHYICCIANISLFFFQVQRKGKGLTRLPAGCNWLFVPSVAMDTKECT